MLDIFRTQQYKLLIKELMKLSEQVSDNQFLYSRLQSVINKLQDPKYNITDILQSIHISMEHSKSKGNRVVLSRVVKMLRSFVTKKEVKNDE